MICWRIYASLNLSELNDPNIRGIVGKYFQEFKIGPLTGHQFIKLATINIVLSYIVIWIMEIVVMKVIHVA